MARSRVLLLPALTLISRKNVMSSASGYGSRKRMMSRQRLALALAALAVSQFSADAQTAEPGAGGLEPSSWC